MLVLRRRRDRDHRNLYRAKLGPAPRATGINGSSQEDVVREQATFMKSLFFCPSLHLVFKWRFDHLAGAAAVLGRAIRETTPCRFFQNIKAPPHSATGFATRMR
jgi:hypothetical protein